MTTMDHARISVGELWNDADHAAKLAAEAEQAIKGGRIDDALDMLRKAERPIQLLEMRLSDAKRHVEKARF